MLLKKEYDLNGKEFDQQSVTTLIITERKEDPVTPLVFDWSYLSMLNDILHIDENKINVKTNSASPNKVEVNQPQSYNLFADEDEFLRENRYSNYGEVASNIENYLKRVADKKKGTENIQNFEDMKKVLDSLPEMRRQSSNLNKHYELIEEIIKSVKQRKLLDVGEVEQTLLVKDSKGDSFKAIVELADQGIGTFDLLRLCALYSLRYEGDSRCNQLQAKLKERLTGEVRID